MPDEYGNKVIYKCSNAVMDKNWKSIKQDRFCYNKIKSIFGPSYPNIGINAYDLFVLSQLIRYMNIKSVVEIGAGSSSVFISSLGVDRESFALDDDNIPADYSSKLDFKYYKCDIRESPEIKEQLLLCLSKSDMLFIDGEHSRNFAEFYYHNIILSDSMKSSNGKLKPLFIHDWHKSGNKSYTEQQWLLDIDIISIYSHYISTSYLFSESRKKYYPNRAVPMCSLLLW